MYCISLKNEGDTLSLGAALAQCMVESGLELVVLYLYGDLGMGKTTLCRGLLNELGHKGAVKSPTYTLVEPYQFDDLQVYHFDIYRLSDPEELEYMGIRDFLSPSEKQVVCVVEWPEKGKGILPEHNFELKFELSGNGRKVELKCDKTLGEHTASQVVERFQSLIVS